MNQYTVVLTCEDDKIHLARGMSVAEDQLSKEQLDRFLILGAIKPVRSEPDAREETPEFEV